jgi:hypothetical protein
LKEIAMRQALHIFKKDARYLRYEITLVFLFAAAFAAMHLRSPQRSFNDIWLPEVVLFMGVASLVGRVVLAEAIPGDRQFWITRPYRWQSLLAAKLLFIIAFVNLPVFLADVFILIVDRFPFVSSLPGLLWSQVLLFAFLLPFAAFATLSSIKPFQLILFAIAAVIWELTVSGSSIGALSGVGWVRDTVALVAVLATAVAVLFIQYKSRRTLFSRCLALGGITVSAVAFVTMPWQLAFAMQSHLSGQSALSSSIQIGLSNAFEEKFWTPELKPKVSLHIPISVQGIPDGAEAQPDALALSIRSPDGRTTQLSAQDCGNLKRGSISSSTTTVFAICSADPLFFQAHRQQPVTLRATLYLTLFGNARSQTIPLSDQPSNAPDGLQCYTDSVRAEWDVYCRSAFRWPARLVFAKLGHTNANSFTQFVSYSPFPASLSIDPIETRWASAYAAGPTPIVRDVTIIVEEPLAHLRRDFETRDVQLDQFAYPSVGVGPPPIHAIPGLN